MALANIKQAHKLIAYFTTNPTLILLDGQIVWLKDNSGTFKKGDGVTQLSALPFLGGASSQTLAQTLALGKKTNELRIESNNSVNYIDIINSYIQLGFTVSGGNGGYIYIDDGFSEFHHEGLIDLTAPNIRVSQDPTLPLGVATKQYADTKVGLTAFKINFRNIANTITSFFTNSNTAVRTYTFPDRDGVIADNTDLATKQSTLVSGTNIRTVNGNTLLGSTDLQVGTILGNLGTTGIYGVPAPYSSGVANTVTSSSNYLIRDVGTESKIVLDNRSTLCQQGITIIDGGSQGSGIEYSGSGYVSTQFPGTTNLFRAQTLQIFNGNNLNLPIVITGLPIVNYCGNVGTNPATRLDLVGFRQGRVSNIGDTNTNLWQIETGLIYNETASVGTLTLNGQNVMKGVRGAFSSIVTAQTTFTITFGGTQPNNTYYVGITALNALTAAQNYVMTKTTTTFTVTYLTGLTGTVAFDWVLIQ